LIVICECATQALNNLKDRENEREQIVLRDGCSFRACVRRSHLIAAIQKTPGHLACTSSQFSPKWYVRSYSVIGSMSYNPPGRLQSLIRRFTQHPPYWHFN